MLPWNERVVSFQINPESATIPDVHRMAEELVKATELLNLLSDGLDDIANEIQRWKEKR